MSCSKSWNYTLPVANNVDVESNIIDDIGPLLIACKIQFILMFILQGMPPMSTQLTVNNTKQKLQATILWLLNKVL